MPARVPDLAVMTRNAYVGASLDPVTGCRSVEELPGRVDEVWAQAVASDVEGRARAIAAEIEAAAPHLVALQEAARWAAGDVELDLLAGIVGALGGRWRVAARRAHFGGALPRSDGTTVSLEDRGAILAREDVEVLEAEGGTFATLARIEVAGAAVAVPRGWTRVVARFAGRDVALVNAHLELPIQPLDAVQRAQAGELAAAIAGEPRPLVVAGDLNSTPAGAPYRILRAAGLADAWTDARGDAPGPTCCHARDLSNATPALLERIDHVLHRGFVAIRAERTGHDVRAANGRWASDHAGVVAVLRLARVGAVEAPGGRRR